MANDTPVSTIDFEKQLRFAIAKTLTQVAKSAQGVVTQATKSQFTIRTNWLEPSSPFAIKIVAAKPDNLEALVFTRAEWLFLQTQGGTKRPVRGQYLLVPGEGVPKSARGLIQKSFRPKNIPPEKKFVLQTRKGPVIAYRVKQTKNRKGPLASQGLAIFGFEREAVIKQNDPFFQVIERQYQKEFEAALLPNILNALETAK